MFVIMEDVVIRNATGTLACLAVHGPDVARVLGIDPGRLPADEHHHVTLDVCDVPATVAVSRELGSAGVDVYVAPDHRQIAWAGFVAHGGVASGEAAWEHRRVVAGRPRFGVDMGAQTIPLEAGIEARAISHTKGCYVGQEIIVRMRDIGQGRVAKRLVGLRAQGPACIVAGDTVRRDDRDVGVVTSVTRDPATSASIALATVHRDAASEGTVLVATDGTRAAGVVVVALPFA
jgi:folate-binding protein YgfZ